MSTCGKQTIYSNYNPSLSILVKLACGNIHGLHVHIVLYILDISKIRTILCLKQMRYFIVRYQTATEQNLQDVVGENHCSVLMIFSTFLIFVINLFPSKYVLYCFLLLLWSLFLFKIMHIIIEYKV